MGAPTAPLLETGAGALSVQVSSTPVTMNVIGYSGFRNSLATLTAAYQQTLAGKNVTFPETAIRSGSVLGSPPLQSFPAPGPPSGGGRLDRPRPRAQPQSLPAAIRLCRNRCVRACWGCRKICSGGPCSKITPPSRKQTRPAMSRAKPIS